MTIFTAAALLPEQMACQDPLDVCLEAVVFFFGSSLEPTCWCDSALMCFAQVFLLEGADVCGALWLLWGEHDRQSHLSIHDVVEIFSPGAVVKLRALSTR